MRAASDTVDGVIEMNATVGGAIASCVFGIALLQGAGGAVADGTVGSLAGYLVVLIHLWPYGARCRSAFDIRAHAGLH